MVSTPDWVNVVSFGADPTGATDSTTAINNAISSITSSSGGVVYFPSGIFKVQSTGQGPISVTANNITIRGDGPNTTAIITGSTNHDVFDLSGFGSSVLDLNIQSSVTRNGGWYISMSGNNTQVTNFSMNGAYGGILLTGNDQWVTQGIMNSFASGATGIKVQAGTGTIRIDTVVMDGSTTTPTNGIWVTNTADMKINDCDIVSMGTDLNVQPGTGQSVDSLWVMSSTFDNGSGVAGGVNGVVIQPSGNGNVQRMHFIGCWTSSHTNQGFLIENNGSGVVNGIVIMGHESYGNGVNGLEILNPVTGVEIIGGTLSGNTGSGIVIGSNVTDFTISGVQCGNYGWPSGNTGYGINVSSGCDHYIISNNRLRNNSAGGLLNSSSGSANNYVVGNIT